MTSVEASLSSGKIGREGFVVLPDVVPITGRDIQILRDGHIQQTLVHAGFKDIINIREREILTRRDSQTGVTRDGYALILLFYNLHLR